MTVQSRSEVFFSTHSTLRFMQNASISVSYDAIVVVRLRRKEIIFLLLPPKLFQLATSKIYQTLFFDSLCILTGNDVTSCFRCAANGMIMLILGIVIAFKSDM